MKLNDYQKQADTFAVGGIRGSIVYGALGLAGEAGEIAEKVKKMMRGEALNELECAKELGDVLWYIAHTAGALGFSLEDIASMNIKKLKSRKTRNKIKGSGDNR